MKRLTRLLALSAAALGVAAAAAPSVLATAEGGLWEVTRSGAQPVRVCAPNPALLAQFEHRGTNCTREVIRDSASSATLTYSCPGGGFGRSTLTLVTPRSLRVETQGISGNAPFNYTLQARRIGDCSK